MTMEMTIDLDGHIAKQIESKINEKLPDVVEEVLRDNIDKIIKDVVIKQLRGCALIYLQSREFKALLMDKVMPKVNEMVGVDNDNK